jgi:hypothetical protein
LSRLFGLSSCGEAQRSAVIREPDQPLIEGRVPLDGHDSGANDRHPLVDKLR